MAQQEESLAIAPAPVMPSLPVEIALLRMSRAHPVKMQDLYVPPGHWTETFFQKPSRRERRAAQEEELAREDEAKQEEERQSALGKILVQLKQTATEPQAVPEPVVLYNTSKKKGFKPSRPKLESPSYMKRMVETVELIEMRSLKLFNTDEKEIDWLCGWMDGMTQQIIEKIREAADSFKSREQWSILAKVASGILAGISVLFGISLLTSPAGGVIVGGLLLASGILSIVNLIFEETHVWDWVAEKIAGDDKKLCDQLKAWIPAGVGMLSMLVGSAGTIGALFFEAFNMIREMLMAGKTVADIAKHIAKMAEGAASSKMLTAQAETEHMQTQVTLSDGNLKGALERLRQISSMVKRSCTAAHQMIANELKASQMQEIQG